MNESLIIYKHNKKIKNPRFYMYSEDQESLILVAEKQQDHDHEWIISQDSINLNRTNKFFIGILQKAQKNQSKSVAPSLINTYVGFINNHEIIRVRKIDNSLQNYSISFLFDPNKDKFHQIQTQFNANELKASINETDSYIESLTQINNESYVSQLFEFKYDNKICFSIKQNAKDEYIVKYLEPIDHFKAFCAAISIILIISKQNDY